MDIGSNIITKFKMKRQHFLLKPDYLIIAFKISNSTAAPLLGFKYYKSLVFSQKTNYLRN